MVFEVAEACVVFVTVVTRLPSVFTISTVVLVPVPVMTVPVGRLGHEAAVRTNPTVSSDGGAASALPDPSAKTAIARNANTNRFIAPPFVSLLAEGIWWEGATAEANAKAS